MIGIEFLRTKSVDGLEFLDFQNKSFASTLTNLFNEHIIDVLGRKQLSATVEQELYKILNDYTGFRNIKLTLMDIGNLAIDVAYFSPRHILNSKMADRYAPMREMTMYKWFTKNGETIFNGGIDFTTGKVTGSFRDLPIRLYANRNLDEIFDERILKGFDSTYAEVMAACVCHEIGHAFGGCALMSQNTTDNYVIKTAIEELKKIKRREDRVIVIKDTKRILDLKDSLDDKAINEFLDGDAADQTVLLYFTKLINRRNNNRALSLGVPEMTSEVLADTYAIRMGFDKGLLAGLHSLYVTNKISIRNGSFALGAIMTSIVAISNLHIAVAIGSVSIPILGAMFLTLSSILWTMGYFNSKVSGTYNTDQRRFEDAIRQLIAKVKVDKEMNDLDKKELINLIDESLKINEQLKPVFNGTAFGRFTGWLVAGADFKNREFEHYTQALANNEISLLGAKLSNLTK